MAWAVLAVVGVASFGQYRGSLKHLRASRLTLVPAPAPQPALEPARNLEVQGRAVHSHGDHALPRPCGASLMIEFGDDICLLAGHKSIIVSN